MLWCHWWTWMFPNIKVKPKKRLFGWATYLAGECYHEMTLQTFTCFLQLLPLALNYHSNSSSFWRLYNSCFVMNLIREHGKFTSKQKKAQIITCPKTMVSLISPSDLAVKAKLILTLVCPAALSYLFGCSIFTFVLFNIASCCWYSR